MTQAELDDALDAAGRPGAVLLSEADWEAIMRHEPPEVRRATEPLRPWTYRGVNVWITYDRPSVVISEAEARRRGLS